MYIVRSVFADPSYNQAESRLMIRMEISVTGYLLESSYI